MKHGSELQTSYLPREPAVLRHPSGLSIFLARAFVALTFLPYLAVPLGGSTSVPAAAVVGALAWLASPRSRAIDSFVLTLFVVPTVVSAIAAVFTGAPFPLSGVLMWAGTAATVAGGAAAIVALRRSLSALLSWLIIGTALFGIVQLAAIRSGVIPFVEFYRASGYASVETNAFAIITYIQRPFAQFPEPSFMAGSMSLALIAMVVIARGRTRERLTSLNSCALLLGAVVVFLSASGSAIVCLALIAVVLVLTSRRSLANQVRAVVAVVIAGIGGSLILQERGVASNFSWGDRFGSIVVAFDYWVADVGRLFLGAGRGQITTAFTSGVIDPAGYQFVQVPADVYSVQARVLFEYGLLGGAVILFMCCLVIVRQFGSSTPAVGVIGLGAWIVVAGFTISYESASMIWLIPGVALGLAATRDTAAEEVV
ncbi:hypothetical protein [Microbacterium sp. LWH3-1.2]|uniref:hypothetical protein n=1 Tax=Microbacterium sp. LWH3-1.2 TaxID=3135256 RepID=UPI0034277EB7